MAVSGFNAGRGFTSGIRTGGRPPVRTGPNRGQNQNRNQNPNKGNKSGGAPVKTGPKGNKGGHQPKVNPNSFQANPFSYTAPYTKGEKSQAAGIRDAITKGPIAALASQRATNVAANVAAQQTDFGYYMSLAKAAQDAVAQQGQIGAGLNTTLAGIGANTQQTLQGLGQAQQGGAVGRFNALGLGGDSAAQIAATQAQQQGLGALNSQAFQSAGALQGGNYQSYANQMPGVAALSGQEQIGNLARAGALANSTIDAQIAAKRAGAGSAYATALGQIRQQEVSGNLAQQTILGKQQQFNQAQRQQNRQFNKSQQTTRLDTQVRARVSREEAKARNALAQQSLNQRSFENTVRNRQAQARIDIANRKSRNGSVSGPGGAKALPTVSNNLQLERISEILNAVPTLQQNGIKNKDGTPKFPHPTLKQIRGLLGGTYDNNLVTAAFEMLGWGHLTPPTARILHNMGIRGITFRGRPVRVAPPPSGQRNSGGGGTTRPASATDVANAGF